MKYEVLVTNWGFGGNIYREKGEIADLDPSTNPPPKLFKAINQIDSKVETKIELSGEAMEVQPLGDRKLKKKS